MWKAGVIPAAYLSRFLPLLRPGISPRLGWTDPVECHEGTERTEGQRWSTLAAERVLVTPNPKEKGRNERMDGWAMWRSWYPIRGPQRMAEAGIRCPHYCWHELELNSLDCHSISGTMDVNIHGTRRCGSGTRGDIWCESICLNLSCCVLFVGEIYRGTLVATQWGETYPRPDTTPQRTG